jgi:GNAT superfamily N-acetyltransferase
MGDDVACYVVVAPEARPAALGDWLAERGLEPGWGWMSFRRGLEPVERRPTALRLVRVGAAEARDFGRIVVTGYGLPAAAAPWAAEAPNLGWDCWLALDGDEPAAAAGVFMAEGVGYLGFAATLPEHRGMGGQNALLAERIDHAREAGCDVVVTETGELREELPSNSYRNILRAGFTEVAVRANWLRPVLDAAA